MAQADEVPERGPDQEQPSAEQSSAQTAQAALAVEVAADVSGACEEIGRLIEAKRNADKG